MRELLQHLPAVIYEYTIQPDGKRSFNFVSQACESILGLHPQDVMQDPSYQEDIRHELAGKDLVCWCSPKSCHADILLEIANAD